MRNIIIKIRQSPRIKGIRIPCDRGYVEVKTLQYADDSTIIVNDEKSIEESLMLIENFSNISGLTLNRNKTQAIWVGCWKFKKKQIHNIAWNIYPDNKLKVLGLYLKGDKLMHQIPENWESKIVKCENIIKSWRNRNLSIAGKIILAKSLLTSQFVYVMQATILPSTVIKRINTLLFKFIWCKQDIYKEDELKHVTERVKRTSIIQKHENQGLNMIDMDCMQISLAINWVKRLKETGNGSWKHIIKFHLNKICPNLGILKSNTHFDKLRGLDKTLPYFCMQLLKIWTKELFRNDELTCENSTQLIWNNNLITYKNSVIYIKRWINCGIVYVSEIINENGQIDYGKITRKIPDSPLTRFELNIVTNAFRNIDGNIKIMNIDESLYIRNKSLAKWKSQDIRQLAQYDKKEMKNNLTVNNINYSNKKDVWCLSSNITKEGRLISMQWKILHGIYTSNAYLFKIKVKDSPMCMTCNVLDTVSHYFVHCIKVTEVWKQVQNDISIMSGKNIILTEENKILGLVEKLNMSKEQASKANLLILLSKLSIHKCKCKCEGDIKMTYEYEKHVRNLKN